MTSQITIDSVLNEGVNEIISSDVMNNELDMTKEIQAKHHPNANLLRFPTKGSINADQMSFNPNDISGIPINEDLLRSEKEISGNFIGTQDLKEALGFIRPKSNSNISRGIPGKKVENSGERSARNLAKINVNKVVSPSLMDPFSPRNMKIHTTLSNQLREKDNSENSNGNLYAKKFEFPGKDLKKN